MEKGIILFTDSHRNPKCNHPFSLTAPFFLLKCNRDLTCLDMYSYILLSLQISIGKKTKDGLFRGKTNASLLYSTGSQFFRPDTDEILLPNDFYGFQAQEDSFVGTYRLFLILPIKIHSMTNTMGGCNILRRVIRIISTCDVNIHVIYPFDNDKVNLVHWFLRN